jgi:hypothetical protein
VSWARTFAWAIASLAAANTLHLSLFKATLSTRLAFFDTTPLGRVIQRFTKVGWCKLKPTMKAPGSALETNTGQNSPTCCFQF